MKNFLTVSELNGYIGDLISTDLFLADFWVKGEISGFRLYQQSGHMYFTLKDGESTVSAVMFKSRARQLGFVPEDGMEILVRGGVSVFAKQGKYQLYVEEMQPYGIGGLFLYLEKLKARLAGEGCFDPAKKRPIPSVVNRVGIVTSQDGAALRDILRVLKQRHDGVDVVLAHSSVQGSEAPKELARGIRLLNEYGTVEVIIVGRGGGSFEDLMAFNSEEVVRAICESQIPVISAVGHEVDFSLADLAADLRAATPTQAAALAVPDLAALERGIGEYRQRLSRSLKRKMQYNCEVLDRLMMKKVWKEPAVLVDKRKGNLLDMGNRLAKAGAYLCREKKMQLSLQMTALDSLSPIKIMQRGYALVSKDDKIMRGTDEIERGDRLKLAMKDAELEVEVINKERVRRWKI
ncbi:MAG: exodeoxyribonuclease VII large subunit [Syntrophomonas sp.]